VRAWICYVKTDPHDHEVYRAKIRELIELAKAAGHEVVGETVQLRLRPHSGYLFGKGKVLELRERMEGAAAELAIFYDVLTSAQKYNITTALGTKVIDRYDLTLEIFEMASFDRLSKLQIELAGLEKAIPYEKLQASLRFRRGREHPGPKSMGEYAYHSTVSTLYKMKASVKREIELRRSERLVQLRKRRRSGIPTACLAGYYNAGKTSLFNALTGTRRDVRSTPFTTLASKYSRWTNHGDAILLIDTIGFAMDLDPRLIASFSLTLDDIRLADLVILVVDISDDPTLLELRVNTSAGILRSLGIADERLLVAANKVDKLDERGLGQRLPVLRRLVSSRPIVPISVSEGRGLSSLAREITERGREIAAKPTVEA